MSTRQHHAVVVRFVAIAIDNDNVVGFDNRLHNDFVGRGCAVGGKKGLLCTERTRSVLLREFKRAHRFKQRI